MIGILMIRLSQSGSIVNGAPLLRPLQVLENSPRAEGFTGRGLSLRREVLCHGIGYQNSLGLLQWKGEGESVETAEGEGAVRGAGTEASFPFRHFEQ